MTIKIEWTADYGYLAARAYDDTGRYWVWSSKKDGSTFRTNGAVDSVGCYRTKAPGASDYRRLSKAQAERIAPDLEVAIKAHLAAEAPPLSKQDIREVRRCMREQIRRGSW